MSVDTTHHTYIDFIGLLQEPIRESRFERTPLALLIVQLHGIDKINSVYGYQVSHSLHVEVANWLSKNLRDKDSVITLANYKFGILLNDIRNEGHVVLAVNKISSVSSNVFSIKNHQLKINISTGIALLESHDIDADGLLHNAEAALEHAIKYGKSYTVYSPEIDKKNATDMDMLSELETALEKEEFEVVYQPKVRISDHIPYGTESLLRWNSEYYGPVSPAVFIPLIEESPYMFKVTEFVLNQALNAQSQWPVEYGELSVSVNIPPIILQQKEIEAFIKQALSIWGNDPSNLTLEITETSIMHDQELSSSILGTLRRKGISISIDDFGTGYSSLAYFKNMPANEVKIDKSFVLTMLEDDANYKLVKTIIELAHNFELLVVAEGVETQETFDALKELGCDNAQGYYISEALPSNEFIAWLHSYHS